ncbi:MAG: transketolase [Lachnospiraceae bacterium]|nr:transketolase [Lachnospiraceae bacterium]
MEVKTMNIASLEKTCRAVRRDIINLTADAASGHPGGSLSSVEIMVTLFFDKMNIDPADPRMENRDRFVLSKGHAAPCYYGVLAERGFFDKEQFKSFRQINGILQGHPDVKKCPGVDASTGSLGQGISIAVGMALGARLAKNGAKVYTLLGDGELQEGQVWEAAMAAAHYKLDNLTVIIDYNGLQIDGTNDQVMSLGNINDKFTAFGFQVIEVADGNDLQQISDALDVAVTGKPKCILAHTVKGKGVSYMENQVGWHGKGPNEEERQIALKELED